MNFKSWLENSSLKDYSKEQVFYRAAKERHEKGLPLSKRQKAVLGLTRSIGHPQYTGGGIHKSKRDYNRQKEKEQIKKEY